MKEVNEENIIDALNEIDDTLDDLTDSMISFAETWASIGRKVNLVLNLIIIAALLGGGYCIYNILKLQGVL